MYSLKLFVISLILLSVSVEAQERNYNVFVDKDRNGSTGCVVNQPDFGTSFQGIDGYISITTTATPVSIVSSRYIKCENGVFDSGSSVVDAALGLNTNYLGHDIFEAQISTSDLDIRTSSQAQLYFSAESPSSSDIVTRNNGNDILVGVTFPIPAVSLIALFVITILFLILAKVTFKNKAILTSIVVMYSSVVWAMLDITIDGQVNDWKGTSASAQDPLGDNTGSGNFADISQVFAVLDRQKLVVRVDIVDVENQAPTNSDIEVSVLEESSVLITLQSNDLDGDNLIFSLTDVSDGTLSSLNQINNTTSQLTYTPNNDFFGSDSFTYTTNDGQLKSDPATVNIIVEPVNDMPSFTSGGDVTIEEDSPMYFNLWASDISAGSANEAGQSLSFSVVNLTNGGIFSSHPTIDSNGFLSISPSIQANGTATATVRMMDDGGTINGGIDTATDVMFDIVITAINDNPIINSPGSITVLENQVAVTDVDSSDIDGESEGGNGLTYSLTGSVDDTLFVIDTNTGVLTFMSPPDFENPTDVGSNNVYDVQATVTDSGGLMDSQSIAINVTNNNEAPSITSISTASVEENQNFAIDVDSIDPDGEIKGAGLSYSLTGSTDETLFNIDANTGIITFLLAADFENPLDSDLNNIYEVQVTVTDSGGLMDIQDVAITVTDINEAPVIVSNKKFNTIENQTFAGDIDSTDQDGDTEGAGLTYTITGAIDDGLFSIDTNTGELSFLAPTDFENPADVGTDNNYNLQVTVTDSGGLTDNSDVTVTVTNADESPSITTTNIVQVQENTSAVIDIDSIDPEGEFDGNGLSYSITGIVDDALFSIDINTGELSFLVAPSFENPMDSDTNNIYEVQVTVTDSTLLTDVQNLMVTVADVDEDPSITSSNNVIMAENQSLVIDVESIDPEGEIEGAGLTYNLGGIGDFSLFFIDPSSGVLTFIAPPNFEMPNDIGMDNIYNLDVLVIDSNNNIGVQNLAITITDVNDAPVITTMATATVVENTTDVMDINSIDEEGDIEGLGLSYSFSGGDDDGLFNLDANSGDLSFIVAPDFESPNDLNVDNMYEVQVTVTDTGLLTDVQDIIVSVTNDIVDDSSVQFVLPSSSIAEDAGAPFNVIVELTVINPLSAPLSVDIIDAGGGTAISGTDYNVLNTQTITFPLGANNGDTMNVLFNHIDDDDIESNETINLQMQNIVGPGELVGQTTHTITINDDDIATLSFNQISSATSNENTDLVIDVILNIPGGGQLDVPVSADVVDLMTGSAISVTDYNAIGVNLISFPIGSTNGSIQQLSFTPLDDTLVEGDEDQNLQIQNPQGSSNVSIGLQENHQITIVDTDIASFEFSMASSSTLDEATALNVSLIMTTTPIGGSLASPVTVSITEGVGSATTALDYNSVFPDAVFPIASSDNSTINTVFTPLQDTLVEGDETKVISISGLVGPGVIGAQSDHTVTITDDEAAATIAFNSANSSVAENAGAVHNVLVTLTSVGSLGQDVTVDVTDALSGDATSGSDFTAIGTQILTFSAGTVSGTMMMATTTPVNDINVENNETIDLQLGNVTGPAGLSVQTTHTASIIEDDTATVEFISNVSATVDEDTAVNIPTQLTIPSGGILDVAVTFDVVDAGGGSATSGVDYTAIGTDMLSFAIGAGNGDMTNTSLSPMDDLDSEGDETVNLQIQNVGGAVLASIGGQSTHTSTITDDDNSPPMAMNDSYNVTGNIGLNVPVISGVIGNDTDPEMDMLTVSASDLMSVQGGSVSVNANGSFTYDPPVGYTGADSFSYTASDGFLTSNATVNLTVSNRIWFIDNSAAVGTGKLSAPFNTVSAFQSVNDGTGINPADGECVFIDETGGGDYIGPLNLLANQIVLGKATTQAIATGCGITLATHSSTLPTINGTPPVLTSPSTGVSVSTDNTLRGFNIGNATTQLLGNTFGTLTINEMALVGTGKAVELITGTAAISLISINSSNSINEGVLLRTVNGSFNVTGLTNITNPTAFGLSIDNSNLNYNFGDVTVNNRNSAGVFISAFTGGQQIGQFGTVTINNQNSVGTTAFGINNIITAGSSITVNAVAINNNNGTGSSIALSNNGGAAININGGSVTGNTGIGVSISSNTGGSVMYSGTISNTNGRSLRVLNNTGGTSTIAGNITDTGTGISISNNTGAFVNMFGTLNVNTGNNTAFSATGGGTINVNGLNNTLTTTTGTAVNISATTIGVNGVRFRSVASNGSTNGIVLNNTGSSGQFIVSGDGGSTTLGGNNSGGTIASPTSDGISIIGTVNATLRDMRITTPAVNGINIDDVTGTILIDELSISNVDVANTSAIIARNFNGTPNLNLVISNNEYTDSDTGQSLVLAQFRGAIGTSTVNLTGNRWNNNAPASFQIDAYEGSGTATNGTLNHVFSGNTVENSTVSGTGDTNHSCGGGAVCTFNISNNTYDDLVKIGNFNSGILNAGYGGGAVTNTSQMNLTIDGNNLSHGMTGLGNRRGINVINEPNGANVTNTMTVGITDNIIDDIGEREAVYFSNRDAGGTDVQTVNLTISGNEIGTGMLAGSSANNIGGSRDGFFIENAGSGTSLNVLLDDNRALTNNMETDSILEVEADDGGTVNVTVTNNTFSSSVANPQIEFQSDDSSTMCVDVRINTNNGSWEFDEEAGSSISIEGAGMSAITVGALNGSLMNTGTLNVSDQTVSFNNNINCTMP